MDFRELQYILTVAKTKNITKASELLRISQPSLSQFVHKVERDLGCELFYRGYRSLILTPAGEEYVHTARLILLQREELEQKLNDLSKMERGKLVVGITSQRGGHMLPKVISEFKKNYPGIELKISEKLTSDDLEKMALEGECDVFISNLPLAHEEITYRVLTDDILYLVLPPTYRLPYKISQFTFERVLELLHSLRDEDFILPPPIMKLGRLVASLFDILGDKPKVMFETHNIDTAQYMVLNGIGVTFTLRSVSLEQQVKKRPLYIPIDDSRFRTSLVAGFSNRDYVSKIATCFVDDMCRILQANLKSKS